MVIDGIWCNQYSDGKSWTPYHKDNYDCNVYCICLGATRTVAFKPDSGGAATKIQTKSGDMYVFTPAVDKKYKHSVPKTTAAGIGERISIVLFGQSQE